MPGANATGDSSSYTANCSLGFWIAFQEESFGKSPTINAPESGPFVGVDSLRTLAMSDNADLI